MASSSEHKAENALDSQFVESIQVAGMAWSWSDGDCINQNPIHVGNNAISASVIQPLDELLSLFAPLASQGDALVVLTFVLDPL